MSVIVSESRDDLLKADERAAAIREAAATLPTVAHGLELLALSESKLRSVGWFLMQSGSTSGVFTKDLLAIVVMNRAVAMSAGFRMLIEARNSTTAGAIVRMQIDNAIRFFAASLVSDVPDFIDKVLQGEQIRKLQDRSGHKMTDFHLIDEFDGVRPGARSLYERACGYVHFSDLHVHMCYTGKVDRANHVVGIQIAATDRELPQEYYWDICSAFCTASDWVADQVLEFIDDKPPLEETPS